MVSLQSFQAYAEAVPQIGQTASINNLSIPIFTNYHIIQHYMIIHK
jgi:hypothetical protein